MGVKLKCQENSKTDTFTLETCAVKRVHIILDKAVWDCN